MNYKHLKTPTRLDTYYRWIQEYIDKTAIYSRQAQDWEYATTHAPITKEELLNRIDANASHPNFKIYHNYDIYDGPPY